MTGINLCCLAKRARAVAFGLCLAGGLVGCGALDVSDPTAIEDSELSDATGAGLLRGAALKALARAVSAGTYFSGLLADEFFSNPPSFAAPGTWDDEVLDRRESDQYEERPFADGGYALWQEVRRATTVAMPKLRDYAPAGAADAKVGEMLAVRGFATLRLAEDFCPGFPLHDVVDLKPVFGPPLSTGEALEKALADFDSAVAYAADSARILRLATVGRARTLLALGRFAEAGTAASGVPTEYVANVEYLQSSGLLNDQLVFGNLERSSVADQEGGNGLDFVSARDPRVEADSLGVTLDGSTAIYGIAKYPTVEAPIVLASGVEARLIEAEAALDANPASGEWLAILNALRTTGTQDGDGVYQPGTGGVAGLAPLTDPGTPDAREDLLFRERAFWLFATGHRLADLRRLVHVYGRQAEAVFPTGTYRLGGAYGAATSIPFPAAKDTPFNPAVTGCTSR